jgi:hypothetical protein
MQMSEQPTAAGEALDASVVVEQPVPEQDAAFRAAAAVYHDREVDALLEARSRLAVKAERLKTEAAEIDEAVKALDADIQSNRDAAASFRTEAGA